MTYATSFEFWHYVYMLRYIEVGTYYKNLSTKSVIKLHWHLKPQFILMVLVIFLLHLVKGSQSKNLSIKRFKK